MRMRNIGFSPARRAIAQYVRAAGRINHVTMNMEVRADRLREFCAARDITYTPVLMKVIAAVAAQYPELNAVIGRRWLRTGVFVPAEVDMSVAIEKEYRGEIIVTTPVVRRVDSKPLGELAREIQQLVATPFEQRPDYPFIRLFYLLPDPFKYLVLRFVMQVPALFVRFFGTIGFSNLGKFGVQDFYPIWLHAAVFGVGTVQDKPVVRHGAVVVAPVLNISYSFNHGVVDGAAVARILGAIRDRIEQGRFEGD